MTTAPKYDFSLYFAACEADDAWMAEIKKAFPRHDAGNVRYTTSGNGTPGSALRAAYDRWVAANDSWRAEMTADHKEFSDSRLTAN